MFFHVVSGLGRCAKTSLGQHWFWPGASLMYCEFPILLQHWGNIVWLPGNTANLNLISRIVSFNHTGEKVLRSFVPYSYSQEYKRLLPQATKNRFIFDKQWETVSLRGQYFNKSWGKKKHYQCAGKSLPSRLSFSSRVLYRILFTLFAPWIWWIVLLF